MLIGEITRQTHVRTRDVYDFRVFMEYTSLPHSVKMPIRKYSVDEGGWRREFGCF